MKILAVDTSCDESCASVLDVEDWKILSDVVHTHIQPMLKFGGVVPEIASREHLKALPLAVHEALERAGLTTSDIDWLAVTHRPGLIGALLIGVTFIKSLAFALGKSFSVFNHIEAHLFSPLLITTEGGTAPAFPWIALVVSGGHTELFLVEDALKYRWLGGTLDDAAGEAFDKIGKLLQLPYPGGPEIDRWVRETASHEHHSRFHFPRAKTQEFSFSYSGLKTAVNTQIKKMSTLNSDDRLALAACAQEAILDPLVEQVKKAQEKFAIKNVVITGGVACNSRLREKFPQAYFPLPRHCTDNAAMVALLSGLHAKQDRLIAAPWETTAIPFIEFPPSC